MEKRSGDYIKNLVIYFFVTDFVTKNKKALKIKTFSKWSIGDLNP